MLDNTLSTRILKAVDAGFEEQVAFTKELIRFPSLRSAEQTAQDFVAAALRERQWKRSPG